MRFTQSKGERGSLKWIQTAVEERWPDFEQPILDRLGEVRGLEWVSPLRDDGYAEYRDGAFLARLGLERLEPALKEFWPAGGPQWDALGRTGAGQTILVEAKAHIAEFCSPASQASSNSLALIHRSLQQTAHYLGVSEPHADRWHLRFYQYANRLAHLYFLRQNGVDAYLVLAGFCYDDDMPGHTIEASWSAAYQVANFAMGLPRRHALSRYVIHAHIDVRRVSTLTKRVE